MISKSFPTDEKFGLTNQIRRCSVSIPSNIAEGYGRNSTNDYKRFLQISLGSLYELQTQIEIANNLKYIDLITFEEVFSLCIEIDKMLYTIIKKIN
ncbi:four helix bundle protein [Ferruginibacter sp. SUN002]|uniref:four helix bundle protein n=1 Tax=Ferruginibacter sp. SUN002 TaxID=2937789 RepID=UPI003D367558